MAATGTPRMTSCSQALPCAIAKTIVQPLCHAAVSVLNGTMHDPFGTEVEWNVQSAAESCGQRASCLRWETVRCGGIGEVMYAVRYSRDSRRLRDRSGPVSSLNLTNRIANSKPAWRKHLENNERNLEIPWRRIPIQSTASKDSASITRRLIRYESSTASPFSTSPCAASAPATVGGPFKIHSKPMARTAPATGPKDVDPAGAEVAAKQVGCKRTHRVHGRVADGRRPKPRQCNISADRKRAIRTDVART